MFYLFFNECIFFKMIAFFFSHCVQLTKMVGMLDSFCFSVIAADQITKPSGLDHLDADLK